MTMQSEYMTMAQACGEAPVPAAVWVPGVDFDPYDPDEMEVMRDVWEGERMSRIAELEIENDALRARLAALDES